MAPAYGRPLQRSIFTRFALRTLCPGVYTYAKTTGWPSSYTQLLRNRRWLGLCLNYFYASLRLTRLSNLATVRVKTAEFEATVYYTARSVVPPTSQQATSRASGAQRKNEFRGESPSSTERGPSHGFTSDDPAQATLSAQSQRTLAPPVTQSTTSPGNQWTAGSVQEGLPHAKKRTASENSYRRRAHFLKRWVASAPRFAAVLRKLRETSTADPAGATAGFRSFEGSSGSPNGHEPRERVGARVRTRSLEKGGSGSKWLFFVHGGAFVMGSPDWYRLVINDLSTLTGAKVFCPNYRLAPENTWPAQLVDCRAAYKHLCHVVGVKGEDIIVVGDSAGGNLATALVMSILRGPCGAVAEGPPKGGEQAQGSSSFSSSPAGLLLMSPWLDLSMKGPSYALNRLRDPVLPLGSVRRAGSLYLHGVFDEGSRWRARMALPADANSSAYGCRSPKNHWVSPVYAYDSRLLARMPPTLIHVGSTEILLSDTLIFARRVNEAARGGLTAGEPCTATHSTIAQNAENPFPAAGIKRTSASSVPKNRCSSPESKTQCETEQSKTPSLERTNSLTDANSRAAFSKGASCVRLAQTPAEECSPGGSTGYDDLHGVPRYFQDYGWLRDSDIRVMDGAGVVCASGCSEGDRVQVKVWKDEFHVFPCFSFLEAPNGELSLHEMATWAIMRLAEASDGGHQGRLRA